MAATEQVLTIEAALLLRNSGSADFEVRTIPRTLTFITFSHSSEELLSIVPTALIAALLMSMSNLVIPSKAFATEASSPRSH